MKKYVVLLLLVFSAFPSFGMEWDNPGDIMDEEESFVPFVNPEKEEVVSSEISGCSRKRALENPSFSEENKLPKLALKVVCKERQADGSWIWVEAPPLPRDCTIARALSFRTHTVVVPGSKEDILVIMQLLSWLNTKYGYEKVVNNLANDTFDREQFPRLFSDMDVNKLLVKYCKNDALIRTLAAFNLKLLMQILSYVNNSAQARIK